MDLKAYLLILWRRKLVIVITVGVIMAIVVIGNALTQRIYAASATLRVSTVPAGSTSYVPVDYAERLMNTYIRLATGSSVAVELKQRLGLNHRPSIKAAAVTNTELIRLTVEDPSPDLAANAANELADILLDRIGASNVVGARAAALDLQLTQMQSEIDQARQDYLRQATQSPGDAEGLLAAQKTIDVKQGIYATLLQQREQARLADALQASSVSVVEQAVVPTTPVRPPTALNFALGLVVALWAGGGLAFLFEYLDTRLYTLDQFELVPALSVVGRIPTVKGKGSTLFTRDSSYEEALRRLRTTLFASNRGAPFHTLMVTSAEQGEGKSTLVANFAVALAESKRKVIVVDCDLRRPMLHALFKLPNQTGLSSLLRETATLDEAIQNGPLPGLQVLTSGPLPSNPVELLDASQMVAVMCELVGRWDIVLFDTPAVMPVTDAAVLAPLMDGVLLLVMRGKSGAQAVKAAYEQMVNVGAHVAGLVINRAETHGKYSHYYGVGRL